MWLLSHLSPGYLMTPKEPLNRELITAVRAGNLQRVHRLLDEGADPSYQHEVGDSYNRCQSFRAGT